MASTPAANGYSKLFLEAHHLGVSWQIDDFDFVANLPIGKQSLVMIFDKAQEVH